MAKEYNSNENYSSAEYRCNNCFFVDWYEFDGPAPGIVTHCCEDDNTIGVMHRIERYATTTRMRSNNDTGKHQQTN